jgi:hypothetical protein
LPTHTDFPAGKRAGNFSRDKYFLELDPHKHRGFAIHQGMSREIAGNFIVQTPAGFTARIPKTDNEFV